jgi:hypothetical protein
VQKREFKISNELNTDLLHKYIGGYAPYIAEFVYDLDNRDISIIFVKLTKDSPTRMKLSFGDVLSFSETMSEDALDDNFTDSIIGMHKTSDNVFCVCTEKRELMIRVGREPSAGLF